MEFAVQGKLYVILAYAVAGIVIGMWPSCVPEKGGLTSAPERSVLGAWAPIVGLFIATLGAVLITGESFLSQAFLAGGLVALATSLSRKGVDAVALLASLLALCVSLALPWWRRDSGVLDASAYEFAAFALIVAAFVWLFTAKRPARQGGSPVVWAVIYACLAAFLTFSTGIFDDRYGFRMMWHHWGAYVGPAELLLSGAAVFHDFPVQYGLGPTAVIAGLCGKDCWHATHFVAGFATLAYSVLIAVLALALARKRWPDRFAVLALCLATCFLWTGFPRHLVSPMMTPSVSGLRFLPATLLLTYLFFAGEIEHSRKKLLAAHALWALGVLWSPESAFYVTFLWWPYYLFVRRAPGGLSSRAQGLVKAGTGLVVGTVAFLAVLDGVYRLIYGEWPTLYAILAYAIDPPGPLPINWHGAIWYFLLAMSVGLGALVYSWRKTGDTVAFRRGFLVQLLCYAAFSYFLGRSHDNNLLNILPMLMLVLLSAMAAVESRIVSRTAVALAAVLLGWLPVFGWQAWQQNVTSGRVFTFDSRIEQRFDPRWWEAGLPGDARQAITYIYQHYGEPVTLLDSSYDLVRSAPPDPWSALNGPEDFDYIPSARRREFLSRTAASLKRVGWVVVARRFPAGPWLADFDSAYQRSARLEFGDYYAIRYVPKAQ